MKGMCIWFGIYREFVRAQSIMPPPPLPFAERVWCQDEVVRDWGRPAVQGVPGWLNVLEALLPTDRLAEGKLVSTNAQNDLARPNPLVLVSWIKRSKGELKYCVTDKPSRQDIPLR